MGGRGKLKGIRQCSNCGKDVEIYHAKRMEAINTFCSKECEASFRKSKDLNVECIICGRKYHLKPYQKEKADIHCCSRTCFSEYKKIYMKGDGNHQYGLKGELNSSWKSDEKISYYGYRLIRSLNHPFKNCDGFVFEHRLVAEKYLLTDENSITIDGERYLHEDFQVHHIDFNRLNNDVSNLQVMSASDHMKLHHELKKDQQLNKYINKN